MFAFGFGNEFAEYFLLNNIENTNCYSSSKKNNFVGRRDFIINKNIINFDKSAYEFSGF